ncbi:hypothetical protein [Halobacterium rubrum]|uniref:hypothetical protein n=1 Tax=Halobacterium TaxID=2239 RepID=UPI001F454EBA|nr:MULTISPECIES: hypothetical protein [Halobacterium]MDH5020932.1 hypothetical protein [Halobacterium rubrum]
MAARPPTGDDENADAEPVVFGIATVDEYLRDADVSFPAAGDEVVAAVGDPDVKVGPTAHTVALSTAVERTGRSEFETRREFLDALHDEFERERHQSGGIVSWLRSLVP